MSNGTHKSDHSAADGVSTNKGTDQKNKISRWWKKPEVWVNILTFVFIGVTWYGTVTTLNTQTEYQLLPIVVLGTQDDYSDKSQVAHTLVIRNIGFGPALNSYTKKIVINSTNTTLQLNHRTAISPGGTEDINCVELDSSGKPFELNPQTGLPVKINGNRKFSLMSKLGDPPLKRVTSIAGFQDTMGDIPLVVCTSYENSRRETYATWQLLYNPSDLAIDYVCQSREMCSGKIEQVQKSLDTGSQREIAFANVCPFLKR
jgi:hypothetical protein